MEQNKQLLEIYKKILILLYEEYEVNNYRNDRRYKCWKRRVLFYQNRISGLTLKINLEDKLKKGQLVTHD